MFWMRHVRYKYGTQIMNVCVLVYNISKIIQMLCCNLSQYMCVSEIQMFSFPIFACVNSIKELLWIYVRFLYFTSWSLSSLSSPRASHDEDHYRLLFQITINANTKRTSYIMYVYVGVLPFLNVCMYENVWKALSRGCINCGW